MKTSQSPTDAIEPVFKVAQLSAFERWRKKRKGIGFPIALLTLTD